MLRCGTESFAAVIEQLRAGHGADLLLIDAGDGSRPRSSGLARERIFLPVVAYGIHCPPHVAAAAIKAGARDFLPLPPEPCLTRLWQEG